MTKIKADPDGPEAQTEACSGERTYQELLVNQNPIAQPLASRRLTRKLYKCIKKGSWFWQETHCPLRYTAISQSCVRTEICPMSISPQRRTWVQPQAPSAPPV
uniref:NHP2 ribonucleoprotein n=1 Tax=Piliocolobus tephrosceles TaxID=591936 RepID=A0A8C9LUL9_9PRIM